MNEDIVGLLIFTILAVTTREEVRKTALLSHIAWDTTQTSLSPILLNTMIQVAAESGCHALLINECCGLGEALAGDERFQDMMLVGVQNRVFVREQGVLLSGIRRGKYGMTLFE